MLFLQKSNFKGYVMKNFGDADRAVPAWDLHQPEVDLAQVSRKNLHQIIRDSFADWSAELDHHELKIDGALFVCDRRGIVLCGYPCSGMSAADMAQLNVMEGRSWEIERIGPNAVGACVEAPGLKYTDRLCHADPHLKQYDSYALPIYSKLGDTVLAILGMISKSGYEHDPEFLLKNTALAFRSCLLMNFEDKIKTRLNLRYLQFEKEVRQKDILFQMARKFHSCNDAKSVLTEMMDSIKQIYPHFIMELYISQDFQHSSLEFKQLPLNQRGDLCTRAFMEGQILFETDEKNMENRLAVPLSGKQAVYGVLQIHSGPDIFDESDMQFISMLADSAGTAFENARLYEQSNLLINELRLINEITSRLNQSLRIHDIFHFAAEELIRIFEADYGCILKSDNERDKLVVQSGNISEMIRESFPTDYGFSGMVINSREPVIVSDYLSDRKVESKLMEMTGSRSLMASPIIANGEAIGAVLLTHRSPRFFTYENYRLLRVLSGHIGLALTNATLHAEVRRMAITDHLTGLYVRHYLDEQIKQMQARDACGSLILIDIDNFKKINDTHGHQLGDEVLKQVARTILSSIREEDIAARWGGEEMAIYLPRVSIEHAYGVAERLRQSTSHQTNPQVTISSGVAEWRQGDEKISVEHLFYRADMALYRAKREGRNRVVIEDSKENGGEDNGNLPADEGGNER